MLAETQVVGFLASFARVGAWTQTAPILGQGTVPARVRVLFAGIIALLVGPLRPPLNFAGLAYALPFEIGFGILVGASARVVLAGAEAGGQIMGIQMGLGFAGAFDPIARESSLPTRRMAFAIAALAFITAGGFEAAIRALAMPVDVWKLGLEPLQALIRLTSDVMVIAVRLSAPLLLAGFVANLTMALISKAAPALNVFSVMLALFLAVGFTIMMATAPTFIVDIQSLGRTASEVIWRVLR